MRSKPTSQLESARFNHPTLGTSPRGSMYGFFILNRNGAELRMMSGGESRDGMPWEHVSVSLFDRCPTWDEMSFVKDLFWLPTETVIQFHPPKIKHINFMEYCLHLWSRTDVIYELPPDWTIA